MLRSLLLLPIGLLLLFSCTQKEDVLPTPVPAPGAGSYQYTARQPAIPRYDSLQVTGESRVITNTLDGWDYAEVDITTVPEPASGKAVLQLYYIKPSGQPNAAYRLDNIYLFANKATQATTFSSMSGTLAPASDGTFAGTFSGTGTTSGGAGNPIYNAVKAGTFANAPATPVKQVK
jgi:hypothetical protein